MRRVTHERYVSQSQWVNCDLARRYVGLNLSQQTIMIFVHSILIYVYDIVILLSIIPNIYVFSI